MKKLNRMVDTEIVRLKNLFFNHISLSKVDSVKNVCVIFDYRLKLKDHIHYVSNYFLSLKFSIGIQKRKHYK